jgi:hypothetical protein
MTSQPPLKKRKKGEKNNNNGCGHLDLRKSRVVAFIYLYFSS